MVGTYSSVYLRRKFNVSGAASVTELFLNVQSDDGFIAWINGTEVRRYNMAGGETPYNGFANASAPEPNSAGAAHILYTLNVASLLTEGENTLAIHAFNQTLGSSDFGFDAQLYGYLPDAALVPPRVAAISPPAGELSSLTSVSVQFTEVVSGVDAGDLLINGVPATSVSSTDNKIYTFVFTQPAFGPVVVSWAAGHGIVDLDAVPKAFASTGVTFQYTLLNPSAPTVAAKTPSAGATVGSLTQILVTFSEAVTGVSVADLLVNGVPATGLSGSGQDYTFTLAQPAYGSVSVSWAGGHGITDTEPGLNGFDPSRPGNTWTYTLIDQTPPAVASQTPAAGTLVTNLTQITVTFSEAVTGVNAGDLRINGAPATGLSGGPVAYTFTFAQPNASIVNVSWNPAHGISDTAPVPNAFNATGAGATWQYTTPDNIAPAIGAIVPPPNATVRDLTQVSVTFNEPVTGVDAGDLKINNVAATAVSGSGAGPYTFTFTQPATGAVTIAWATGSGITDIASPPNSFAGGSWSNDLNPDASFAGSIVINEIMFRPASTFPEPLNREWIELRNLASSPVNLSGWRFTEGVDFVFPANASIPANGHIVVAANTAAFSAFYPSITNVVGGWTGTLSNRGENIVLRDAALNQVDEVAYSTEGDWADRTFDTTAGYDWAVLTSQQGRSLELRNPSVSNDNGQNWLPSTAANGSPGATNAAFTANIPPIIKGVKHFPAVPTTSGKIIVSCELNDETENGLLTATLHWRNASTAPAPAFAATPMSTDGRESWHACIPARADKTIIEFYVSATDGVSTRTWPAPSSAGQDANCTFQVDNEPNSTTHSMFRKILTAAEEGNFTTTAANNSGSNRQFNCTIVHTRGNESDIRYRAAFRIRGNSSRGYQFKPLRVTLPNDEPIFGLTAFNLNPRTSFTQYFGNRLGNMMGLAFPRTMPVELRRNGLEQTTASGSTPDHGMWCLVEDFNSEFVDEHYPLANGGSVYKNSNSDDYWMTVAAPGNPDTVVSGWSKQNNSSLNDWTDLNEFATAWQTQAAPHFPGTTAGNVAQANGSRLSGNGAWASTSFNTSQYETLEQVSDFDQWAKWFAIMTILQSIETNLSNGVDDDYAVYFAPGTLGGQPVRRMHLLAHDLDTIFGLGDTPQGPTARGLTDATETGEVFRTLLPLLGTSTVAGNATFRTKYHTALRQMYGAEFNADTTGNPNPPFYRLVDQHLGGWVPAATINAIKTFATQRQAYLLGLVGQAALAPVPGTSNTTAAGPHGSLFISEILAENTATTVSGLFPDIIELQNTGTSAADLAGMSLTDDPMVKAKYVFPAGTSIAAGGFLQIYAVETASALPGLKTGFRLSADGETLQLYSTVASGQSLVDSVTYGRQIANFSVGRTGAASDVWTLCTPTPGAANTAVAAFSSPGNLRINEWLANADHRAEADFVELFNPGTAPVGLGGMSITDDFANFPTRGQIPALSYIAAGGFARFDAKGNDATPRDASEIAVNLGSNFGGVSLVGVNGARVDRVDVVSQFQDRSTGRLPDGSDTLTRLTFPSPGATNTAGTDNQANILAHLRVTEIMYHPEFSTQAEFIELRNTSASTPLDLAGVWFETGLTYTFPEGSTLAPGAHLVLASNPVTFEAQFPGITAFGTYTGRLDNNGERLRLMAPGVTSFVQDFSYNNTWHPSTAGGGASLSIVNALAPLSAWDRSEGWVATAPNPGSTPPFGVYAGADQNAASGVPVVLAGSLRPGTFSIVSITLAWSVTSGPGTVQFTTPDCEMANARFTTPGVYTLRLTATETGGTNASDTVTVTVAETYAQWAARHFTAGQAGLKSDDPDHDGVPNLVEFATGGNPLAFGQPLMPAWENGRFVARFQRNKLAPADVTITVQASTDLENWHAGASTTVETLESGTTTLESWLTEDVTGGPEGEVFFRLRVFCP